MTLASLLHLPYRLIFKCLQWVYYTLTAWMFQDTYMISHRLWLKRNRLGANWSSCEAGFLYSIDFSLPVFPAQQSVKIAIKAQNIAIKKLEFTILAESGSSVFQRNVQAVEIGQKQVVLSLDSIPPQSIPIIFDATASFSWDSYRFVDVRVEFVDGNVTMMKRTLERHLTHTWFLNSLWLRRWGGLWNLDAIKAAKREIAIYWRFRFGMPSVIRFSPRALQAPRRSIWDRLNRTIGSVLGSNLGASILFWLAIWTGAYRFTEDGDFVRR